MELINKVSYSERKLANELACLISQKLWKELEHCMVEGDIYNLGMSNYEDGCYALQAAGIYKQIQGNVRFQILVPVEDVAMHMELTKELDRNTFDLLLEAFVSNFVLHKDLFASHRNTFSVAREHENAAELFVLNGYAEFYNSGIHWTDKIAETMIECSVWNEDGKPVSLNC